MLLLERPYIFLSKLFCEWVVDLLGVGADVLFSCEEFIARLGLLIVPCFFLWGNILNFRCLHWLKETRNWGWDVLVLSWFILVTESDIT